MEKEKNLVSAEGLKGLTREIFNRIGLGAREAETIADHLIEASLRGVDSHGLSRVPIYVKRMREGLVNLEGEIELLQETSVSALLNGNNLPGILVAQKAIEIAVAKAKTSGLAIVGVNQSNHCGMLASYAKYAVNNGCIAIITSNASPSMAPWGGMESFFGTNPLCYGIPAGEENPIIMDMATSVVAKGKIRIAEKNGQQIPVDWAISKDGLRTTDPTEALAGLVLPFGGPKGYGLVVLMDVLSAILTGANHGPNVSSMFESKVQGLGHFFMVFRADLFQPFDTFTSKIDQMIKDIRRVKKMDGVEQIYLPGEIELEMDKRRSLEGIPLPESLILELRHICSDLKIDMQDYLGGTNG